MVQLVDNKTNQVVDLPADQATSAILDGSHSLQQTTSGQIALVSPKGQVFSGPTSGAYQLLQKGWTFESPTDKAKQDVAWEAANQPIQSSLEQGTESFLNQFAGGIPSILNENAEANDEYAKAHRQAEEETHSTARDIGGVAGFLGNVMAAGPAFKGAALAGKAAEEGIAGEGANLATRLFAKAAGGAVEGSLISAPQTITEAAVDDKQKAAESLALGAGLGAILGFGGGAFQELKAAVKTSGEPADTPGILDALQDKADKIANRDALRLAGFQKSQLKKLSDDERQQLGDFLFQRGIIKPGMSKEDIADAINDLHEASGQAVKDHLGKLDDVLKDGAANLLAGEGGNRKFGLTDFITGNAAGHLAGALHVLGPAGAPLAFLGSIFIKHLAENQGNILGATALKKFADADLSKVGILSALAGSDGIDSQAAKISGALKGITISGVQRTDPITRMLGSSATGLSKQQQFNKLSDTINAVSADPNQLANNVAPITTVVHQTGAPQTAQALTDQYTKTVQYLQNALPKPPAPNPFIKQAWNPSAMEMKAFKDKLEVLQNPFSVLNELTNGTLNTNHLDALKNVYPAIYQQLQAAALAASADTSKTVPYATRLKLSLLLGKPLDPSLKSIQAIQSLYGPMPNGNGGRGHDITAPDLSTETQRVSNGQKGKQ